MEIHDKVQTKEQVKIDHTVNAGQPVFKEVKVLAESGIFKAGKQYAKGDTAVIPTGAAETFAANGEVEIIGDADIPTEVQEAIENAQNT